MKTTKTIFAVLLIATTVFIGCKKPEKGETGPQGPAGAQGSVGPQGPAGESGNANVLNYDITVSSWQWTYDGLYERHFYRFNSNHDAQSAVYGYVMSGSGKQSMPYYTSTSAWSEQYDLANALFQTTPYIEFQYTNFVSRTTAPSGDEYFYLVVIPPSRQLEHPNLDYNNYEEVKKAFNLGDPIRLTRNDFVK